MTNYGPKIAVSREGQITIVELLDEEILEEGTINVIADSVFSVVADGTGIKLIISFAQVRHLSSSALGMLIRINKRVEESGGTLKLSHLRKPLLEIFKITRLDRSFDIYNDNNAALRSFNS